MQTEIQVNWQTEKMYAFLLVQNWNTVCAWGDILQICPAPRKQVLVELIETFLKSAPGNPGVDLELVDWNWLVWEVISAAEFFSGCFEETK